MEAFNIEDIQVMLPTADKELDDFVELAFDNLFRIFNITCDKEENFRYRLKENTIKYMEGCGYRRLFK